MACPICGKPTEHAARPFCSLRCKQIDLGRWFNGDYRFASEREEDFAEAVERTEQELLRRQIEKED
ncbi:DNA gyrase inhibitor YacG [Acetobacteraceae bacterium]|nr:DNA gyrase inhibitor YacG [Acetobacteraceae bacterium]